MAMTPPSPPLSREEFLKRNPVQLKRRKDAPLLAGYREDDDGIRGWLKKIGIDDKNVTHVRIDIPLDGLVTPTITLERYATRELLTVEPPGCLTGGQAAPKTPGRNPPAPAGNRPNPPTAPPHPGDCACPACQQSRAYLEGGPSPEEAARKERMTAPPVCEASAPHQRYSGGG